MKHIFISYQRSWETKVIELADKLSSSGLSVWRDNSGKEQGIPFSIKWWDVVEEALYDSVGSIIIDTTEWNASNPCKKEFELMTKNAIPQIRLYQEDLDDIDTAAEKVLDWYKNEVDNETNYMRAYLFGQGYRYKRNPRISRLIPGKIKFFEALSQFIRFKEMEGYINESKITANNPDIDNSIRTFLSKAKRKMIGEQIYKFLIAVFSIIIAGMFYVVIALMPEATKQIDQSDYRARSTGMLDDINDYGDYDEISAMNMLTSGKTSAYLDVSQSFTQMQTSMVDYLSRHYPVDLYPADSDRAKKIASSENDTLSIVSADESGQYVAIYGDIKKILAAECIPSADCYVPELNELFVAYDNRIVAYDLDNTMQGIELTYNFETINKIIFQDNTVYGITLTGNVVCWDNPIQKKEFHHKLERGFILNNGSAVYINDDMLVIQKNGIESNISLPYTPDNTFAVSHSYDKAAIACTDNEGNPKIVIADISSGTIESEYDSQFYLSDIVFSRDDDVIYGISNKGLMRIILSTDNILCKNSDFETFYGAVDYNDHIIVSVTAGCVAEYNSDLERINPWYPANGCYAIPKQMAISDKYKALFTSNRGGNAASGCTKLYIETGDLGYLPTNMKSGLVSNTSVTVSDDGEFVAYGFPNGLITVYNVASLNLLYENRSVAEDIISLKFEGDGLYGLGISGTVYRFDFDGMIRTFELENATEYWNSYVEKSTAIQKKMYELGLSYINVQ